ncbi:MAG: quinolinate synthase NadA [Candidatus Aenigmarchaeota archaeon]|nr:quinolinate synthase NadA [Candidatus Aenigmarchaeota archaeon]NIP40706.1 quinolinate synthase NadA [Candidatus Aenigmarchaeota archaeon]NIQ18512.1 quinolinate synthase NadA [Candidatus Aenigmarchaeota archaeon]NIS73411.1 quinolinate synthase NadA [Candidatus Aenigmarchaeota archaeon]
MKDLIGRIRTLKEERGAVILVHNYQRPEIYRIADHIGDSFGLSKKASETGAEMIVFCGVDFMAECAHILSPGKTTLLPEIEARCPMAAMVSVEDMRKLKGKHPEAAVVSYVNTSAGVKAESDICCTSSNAVKVVNSLDEKDVIFVPDHNLANYVSRHTKKNIIPCKGWCYVHDKFSAGMLRRSKGIHPDAEVVVHPECRPEVIDLADNIFSTGGMLEHLKKSTSRKFIIGTEIGMIERLKMEFPGRTFLSAPPANICLQMKKTTLNSVLESLEKEQHRVTVPEDIRTRAKKALDRMLEVV